MNRKKTILKHKLRIRRIPLQWNVRWHTPPPFLSSAWVQLPQFPGQCGTFSCASPEHFCVCTPVHSGCRSQAPRTRNSSPRCGLWMDSPAHKLALLEIFCQIYCLFKNLVSSCCCENWRVISQRQNFIDKFGILENSHIEWSSCELWQELSVWHYQVQPQVKRSRNYFLLIQLNTRVPNSQHTFWIPAILSIVMKEIHKNCAA